MPEEYKMIGAIIIMSLIFFMPTIIALTKKLERKKIIILLNVVGGWTGFVWIGVLLWAIFSKSNVQYKDESKRDEIPKHDSTQPWFEQLNAVALLVQKKSDLITQINNKIEHLQNNKSIEHIFKIGKFRLIISGVLSSLLSLIIYIEVDIGILSIVSFFFFLAVFYILTSLIDILLIIPEKINRSNQLLKIEQNIKAEYESAYINEAGKFFAKKIHDFGMATPQDILSRIPDIKASEALIKKLLDREVEKSTMERLEIGNGKILYKSKLVDISKSENCETVEICID